MDKRLVNIYRRFNAQEPNQYTELNIPGLKFSKNWVRLGDVSELCYLSTKWSGELIEYAHTFDNPPMLLTDPEAKVLLIAGGNFKITKRGITG
jgi:hypothetical protein